MLTGINYNLGCGSSKIPGCINVDISPENEPDIVADFRKPFVQEAGVADRVFLFHTIEHIEQQYHSAVYLEAYRLLKPGGLFVLSYPEFEACAKRYIENYKGQREFWHATIFGRQSHKADYHVSAMRTQEVIAKLMECGFTSIEPNHEPAPNEFNTIVKCVRGNLLSAESIFLSNVLC